MSKFNTRETNKTENLAGGIAYKHSTEMELVVSVLTTFLENKFYESGDERMARIKNLIGLVKDEFVAKLAIVARNQFHLRSVSHLLVGELARKHRGDNLVGKTMYRVAERPDDLTEIVAYLGKPIPKQVKKAIRKKLYEISPYQLAKYKQGLKKVKLVDLFNLVHPNPKHCKNPEAWKALLKGELKNTETWEARLSSGEDKKKVWHDLVLENKIGYMALLRNLRNISEQADEETKKRACEIISNKDAVLKSKQLPFRFYSAYENVTNRDMLEAIAVALDYSVANVPKLEGKMLVAIDGSGSMDGEPIKKASVLASALIKKNNADVIIYDTEIQNFKYLNAEPVITLAEKIQKQATGGGTDTSLVFQYADGKNYDRIIILSDNESWADSMYGGGTQAVFNEFKKTNKEPWVYAIDIEGYGSKDIKGNKVYHLAGFSEKIFDFMSWIEKENELVDYINSIKL